MELKEDWRESFPGVLAATRFREKAAEYIERLGVDPDEVVAEIGEQHWAHEIDMGGVPQPELDEIRSLFDRAAEALEEEEPELAIGLLEDLIAYCSPEE